MYINIKMMHIHRMRTTFQRPFVCKITTTSMENNGDMQECELLTQECDASELRELGKHNPQDFKESYILPKMSWSIKIKD